MVLNEAAAQAQASLIGSLLLEPKLAGEIFRAVEPDDLSEPSLRTIFQAARELWLSQQPVDPVTLLDRVGDRYGETIADAMRVTPSAANWEAYAKLVRNDARLRRIREAAMAVVSCENADEAAKALAVAQGLLADRESVKISSFLAMSNDFWDRMQDPNPEYLDLGFDALNKQVRISAGRFVLLAAESSVGKTALALQLALGIARGGKRVGFFSLETSAPDAMDRIVAQSAGVPLPVIKAHKLGPAFTKRIVDMMSRDGGIPFDLIEAAGSTVDDVRAVTLQRRYDVIFVDYVQLLRAEGDGSTQQVRQISMDLHRMSQQLGVTVVGLSQVTPPTPDKNGVRKEISKEHLRESHQLIHDAEVILIMDLSDRTNYNSDRILKIDKNKDGPCGRIILRFSPKFMRFDFVPPHEKKTVDADGEEYAGSMFREESGREEGLPF